MMKTHRRRRGFPDRSGAEFSWGDFECSVNDWAQLVYSVYRQSGGPTPAHFET